MFEFQGGDGATQHEHMMANSLTACDVVPSAAHLTASMLASVFPSETYHRTRITAPTYGAQSDKEVKLGSLELLDSSGNLFPSIDLSDGRLAIFGSYSEHEIEGLDITPMSEQLVIMNPPFTRAMSDWIEGDEGTYRPFNAMGNTQETQQYMRAREKLLTRNTCYNGYQSMPSAFCAVAHKMVARGGRIALVLPLTCCVGNSWRKFRDLLAREYEDAIVVSICKAGTGDSAWSANTKISEVLVSAKRRVSPGSLRDRPTQGLFVNLHARPATNIMAQEVGRELNRLREESHELRTLEDGISGGQEVCLGEDLLGEGLLMDLNRPNWPIVGVQNLSLAQFAEQLSLGELCMFDRTQHHLPIRPMRDFAEIGPSANNIANNHTAAFDRLFRPDAKLFPMIWRHNSDTHRFLAAESDVEGRIRPGKSAQADRIWETRSHLHLASELGFTTSRVVSVFTPKRCIGGRSWPSIKLASTEMEKATCVWFNTTAGLILYWYHSSRQQRTRGIMPVRAIADLPSLDVSQLDPDQLTRLVAIYDRLCSSAFKRVNALTTDATRQALDKAVICDVFGLSKDTYEQLRVIGELWCSEPSLGAES